MDKCKCIDLLPDAQEVGDGVAKKKMTLKPTTWPLPLQIAGGVAAAVAAGFVAMRIGPLVVASVQRGVNSLAGTVFGALRKSPLEEALAQKVQALALPRLDLRVPQIAVPKITAPQITPPQINVRPPNPFAVLQNFDPFRGLR